MPRPSVRRRASVKTFVRCPDVFVRQGQGESFLIRGEGDEIFYLNGLGRAVWEFLANPLSEAEATALIASVFPETPRAQIEYDLVSLFAKFKRENLLLEARETPME